MNTNAIGNDMEPATLQANINKLESKPRNDLTFAERHALSHLRHVREKELGRIAWKNCKPYQKEYAICCQREGMWASWNCREELEDMRVCVNRACVRLHESTPELIDLPPPKKSDFA